jgi:catechol 2,3-dioxygenase-like lactoylglutathione lyase family enzyme
MIDHLSVGVADLARSGAFYDAVLLPLGYVRLFAKGRGIGYGPPGAQDEAFAILAAGELAKPPGEGWHIAFGAPSREAVETFHSLALKHGAIDEGGPGLRPHYGAGYYAAFVRDLDGYRIEAVFHES